MYRTVLPEDLEGEQWLLFWVPNLCLEVLYGALDRLWHTLIAIFKIPDTEADT